MDCKPSFDDLQDFDEAERGFCCALEPGIIKNKAGDVVWNIDQYKFLDGECPETAHPHLWRQGQLNSKQGLYKIQDGIYQTRALDLSNMTIVEGKTGIIIIDPLVSCECAAAGLDLYRKHAGSDRPVTGMIYSHSHGDHYMGAQGVLPEAMRRRAAFMYGNALPRAPDAQIGTGLGMASSVGTTSLIPPNLLIQKTGEEHIIDGIRIVFQMVPGTEAPAEINFHFPDLKALCVPETATNCMHNIVTLRGAQVRDAQAWSGYLDEVIAEQLRLPPAISKAWHCRGFYGSLSHNVKGIYQRYMTWFDGNPAHLWQYPPAEEGKRYVECMGGVKALCDKASTFIDRGDFRFAATLLAHAIAAEANSPDPRAKELLAKAYERLGWGAENATWRNFYLTGAQELRTGKNSGMVAGGRTPLGPQLSIAQWFQILSVQLDGERAAESSFSIGITVPDAGEQWQLLVSNGVLISRQLSPGGKKKGVACQSDLEVTLSRAELLEALRGNGLKAEQQSGKGELWNQLMDFVKTRNQSMRGPSQI
ncbi:hypothetical protein KVR01_007461 [Diaporthe batatas]|uniref:uncharacterized protein n=1 Tax=Diaporthe batatas TaxID=748121 RepID=UPI001D055D09|nr:uncharacterized protein KVR01_007461 [Diaporthe batatas]KAG8162983.1 hypothetical protein KVR01_007461 [Diaporthe batatas]